MKPTQPNHPAIISASEATCSPATAQVRPMAKEWTGQGLLAGEDPSGWRMATKPLSLEEEWWCRRLGGVAWLLGATTCFSLRLASAQDSLRSSTGDEAMVARRSRQAEHQPYTVRWGDMRLLAAASTTATWNDNINLVRDSPIEDEIITPGVAVSMRWPITEMNSLSFSLELGYEHYLSHSEFDDVVIQPGSELSWDLTYKEWRFNLHDAFSYINDSATYGMVNGVARLGGLNNTAGAKATREFKDVALTLGYDHVNFVAVQSAFEYLNRSSDFGFAQVGFRPSPTIRLGPEFSGGPNTYEHGTSPNSTNSAFPNSTTFSAGEFVEWHPMAHLKLEQRAGYYDYWFSGAGSADKPGYYLSLEIEHELNRALSYSISGGREIQYGFFSSLAETWYATLQVTWQTLRRAEVTAGFRYENTSQPGSIQDEQYERYGITAGISYPLTSRLTGSLQYHIWLRSSETEADTYNQNSVILALTYRI